MRIGFVSPRCVRQHSRRNYHRTRQNGLHASCIIHLASHTHSLRPHHTTPALRRPHFAAPPNTFETVHVQPRKQSSQQQTNQQRQQQRQRRRQRRRRRRRNEDNNNNRCHRSSMTFVARSVSAAALLLIQRSLLVPFIITESQYLLWCGVVFGTRVSSTHWGQCTACAGCARQQSK